MSRVRNSSDSLLRLQTAESEYQYKYKHRIQNIREHFDGREEHGLINDSLEAHIRQYKVNAFLNAFNWCINTDPNDGLPNMIPESQITSKENLTIRFLDYFGVDNFDLEPLLIVETKHPKYNLPRMDKDELQIAKAICSCLNDKQQHGVWAEWLKTLRDYYHSTKSDARRVLLTNGDWLVLFLTPSDSFGANSQPDPRQILIFKNWQDIELGCGDLFRYIEYSQLSKEIPAINPGELPSKVSPADAEKVMYGLKLSYSIEERPNSNLPRIALSPIVYVGSKYGNWIKVQSGHDESLPSDSKLLDSHFESVEKQAVDIVTRINSILNTSLSIASLADHYTQVSQFEQISGTQTLSKNRYQLVLGNSTHYLLAEHNSSACSHHGRNNTNENPTTFAPVILSPSTDPRAYFVSDDQYHCANQDVLDLKRSAISESNQARCGSRSGGIGSPFCEIYSFETRLCCMTCVYGEICMSTDVFNPPCPGLKD